MTKQNSLKKGYLSIEHSLDGLKTMAAYLDEQKLPFLPMTNRMTETLKHTLDARGITPLRTETISGITDRVLTAKSVPVRSIAAIYIDSGTGELQSIVSGETDLSAVSWVKTLSLACDILDPSQLSPGEKYQYTRACRVGANHKTTTAGILRVRLQFPNIYGNTWVNPEILKLVIGKTTKKGCTNNDQTVDIINEKGIGNSLLQHGLTPLDFIRAEYSRRILKLVNDEYFYNGDKILLPVHRPFLHGPSTEIPDSLLWNKDQMLPCVGDFRPNPEAYKVLTRINRPTLERDPENQNRATFDRIRIRFGILSKATAPWRYNFIKQHRKSLAQIALIRIMMDNSFTIRDIPINMLKLSDMTITRDSELELLFELKALQTAIET